MLFAAGSAAIGLIVWLVRLEGRVNGHDREVTGIRDDLRYIRERIDTLVERR